jgi:hypothetical protein
MMDLRGVGTYFAAYSCSMVMKAKGKKSNYSPRRARRLKIGKPYSPTKSIFATHLEVISINWIARRFSSSGTRRFPSESIPFHQHPSIAMSDDDITSLQATAPESSQQPSQESLQPPDEEETLQGSFELLPASDRRGAVRFEWEFPSSNELPNRKSAISKTLQKWREHDPGDMCRFEDNSDLAREV